MKKLYKPFKLLFVAFLFASLTSVAQTSTYTFTGTMQTYVVGTDVTGIAVNLRGAEGGWNSDTTDYPDRPGYGACVIATLTVTPGEVLNVFVGGAGVNGTSTTGGPGGFNGGGSGENAYTLFSGGGGGGASDIRINGTGLTNRIVVAAGGGGSGLNCSTGNSERGGDGGMLTGEKPALVPAELETGGGGGTPTARSGVEEEPVVVAAVALT